MAVGISKQTAILACLVLFLLACVALFSEFFAEHLARQNFRDVPGNAWLFCALIVVGYVRYHLRVVTAVRVRRLELSVVKLWAVPMALLLAVVEEVTLRAWLLEESVISGLATGWLIALSGLASALLHSVWVGLGGDYRAWFRVFAANFIFGVCLALLYFNADRNLWPCVIAQALVHLAVEPWLMIAAVTGRLRDSGADAGTGVQPSAEP